MSKFYCKILFIISYLTLIYSIQEPKKKLIWSDEFEGNSLNLKKQSCQIRNRKGWMGKLGITILHKQKRKYQLKNILHIKIKKENYKTFQYTSARITTRHNFKFKYGTVEANISLPINRGIWPAFWMLGFYSENWPNCGSINILESKNLECII